MKKLLLLLPLVVNTNIHAQGLKQVYQNDTLNVSSIFYTSVCPISIKRYEDKTLDGIYYTLKPNYYDLFVPSLKLTFHVEKNDNTCGPLGYHLVYLVNRLRVMGINITPIIVHN